MKSEAAKADFLPGSYMPWSELEAEPFAGLRKAKEKAGNLD